MTSRWRPHFVHKSSARDNVHAVIRSLRGLQEDNAQRTSTHLWVLKREESEEVTVTVDTTPVKSTLKPDRPKEVAAICAAQQQRFISVPGGVSVKNYSTLRTPRGRGREVVVVVVVVVDVVLTKHWGE